MPEWGRTSRFKLFKVSKVRRHFWRNENDDSEAQRKSQRHFQLRHKYKGQKRPRWPSSEDFLPNLLGSCVHVHVRVRAMQEQSRGRKRRCHGLNYVSLLSPPSFICWGPNPKYPECDCIWRSGLERGKMRSLGWALIQDHWMLCKKRKLGYRPTEERPCEDRKRRWPSLSQVERPQRKPAQPIFDVELSASRTMRKYCLLFKPSSLWYFVMAALANSYRREQRKRGGAKNWKGLGLTTTHR